MLDTDCVQCCKFIFSVSPPPPSVRHRSSHKPSTSSTPQQQQRMPSNDVDELASVFSSPNVQQNQTNNNGKYIKCHYNTEVQIVPCRRSEPC